jgi:hypothetical protein
MQDDFSPTATKASITAILELTVVLKNVQDFTDVVIYIKREHKERK